MLSGNVPGEGRAHVPLDERAPHLPAELVDVVERCLAPLPARRPRAEQVRDVVSGLCDRMRPAAKHAAPAPRAEAPPAPEAAAVAPLATATRKAIGRRTAVERDVTLPALGEPTVERDVTLPALGEPTPDPSSGAELAALADTLPDPAVEPESDPEATAEAPAGDLMISFPCVADDEARRAAEPARDTAPAVEPAAAQPEEDGDPELTLEAAPLGDTVEVKTLSDAAAAFRIAEGESTIEQAPASPKVEPATDAETREDDSRTKKGWFRSKLARPEKSERTGKAEPAGSPAARSAAERGGPIKSRKQLREANAPPRKLSEEQIRALREQTQRAERRTGRIVYQVVLLLFAGLLVFAVPLLVDPTRTRAAELLGADARIAGAAFAVLSVVALVQTWALQIKARPMMLRPVTITLKVVTATICVLTAALFLPQGSLGPAEWAARAALPWAATSYYLFLGMYGVLHGVRQTAADALVGAGMVLLYCGGFAGSYRVLTTCVLVTQPGERDKRLDKLEELERKYGKTDTEVAAGGMNGPTGEAAFGEEMHQRSEVGASEAEDLRAIEDLTRARQRKGAQFKELGEDIEDVMK